MTVPPVGLMFGEGRGSSLGRYWLASAVASDDGVPWGLRVESNDIAPGGLGGEAAYTMAFITVRAAAGTVLRVTPLLNDTSMAALAIPGGTVEVLPVSVTVPQQLGSPAPLVTQTFEVPLLLAHVKGGIRQAVFHPRGERMRLRIESVGAIGTGAFRLESAEIEHQIMRRATFSGIAP